MGYGPSGIWASSPSDVFVASYTMFHFDGKNWREQPVPVEDASLHTVWGTGPNSVFAAGYDGVVLHYDGKEWKRFANPLPEATFQGIWASGPEDIYLVGHDSNRSAVPYALHYDGKNWSNLDIGGLRRTTSVWGSGPKNVFVAGSTFTSAAIRHWDGARWSTTSLSNSGNLTSVFGASSTKVHAVGMPIHDPDNPKQKYPAALFSYNGNKWSHMPSNETRPMWALAVAPTGEAFAAGSGGSMMRYRRGS